MHFYSELVPLEFFKFALVFCRIGAFLMIMPTIGESYISPRVRLLFSLMMTLVVTPVLAKNLPEMPVTIAGLAVLVGIEILIGLFLAQIMRILTTALSTAGTVIAFVTGFSNAMLFNPLISSQGSLHSVLLSMLGSVLILATDMHHLMLRAIIDSYQLFAPGVMPVVGDMADTIAKTVAKSFLMGMQLASPFLLLSIMYNVLLGLLARLMPQLQVFFIGLPLQIMMGVTALAIGISGLMIWFLRYFAEGISPFLSIG
ncbi:flagellar biosynthetic protein FliR [Aestuariispira ectoiniformans]|uniref:flagellar biosynthetic protein FliR n=1 Tax=Aestuariispira ectoiniformans TaxID=2775080 RepID=UPI0021E3A453|nr:flagellar biosynthetic protein FliR [Aestuariispira ectoiniformans]